MEKLLTNTPLLLAFVFGTLFGVLFSYVMWIRPLTGGYQVPNTPTLPKSPHGLVGEAKRHRPYGNPVGSKPEKPAHLPTVETTPAPPSD